MTFNEFRIINFNFHFDSEHMRLQLEKFNWQVKNSHTSLQIHNNHKKHGGVV